MVRLIGYDAIAWAETHATLINKYTDPTEEARSNITLAEAKRIAGDDANLLWVEVESDAEVILAEIERAFASCVDTGERELIDDDYGASEMMRARELLGAAEIAWQFESWNRTAALIQSERGQWVQLWYTTLWAI